MKNLLVLGAVLLLGLASCSNEEFVKNDETKTGGDKAINFSTYAMKADRGNPIDNNTEYAVAGRQFGVAGFLNQTVGTSLILGEATAGEPMKYDGTKWNYVDISNLEYWPTGGATMSFFAHYPVADSLPGGLNIDYDNGIAITQFTVPADVTKHIDLLYANAFEKTQADLNADNRLPLQFKHALTAICFNLKSSLTQQYDGADKFEIKVYSITLNDVASKGDAQIDIDADQSGNPPAWSNLSELVDYTYSVTTPVVVSSTDSVPFPAADSAMIIIPQEFVGKTITITYTIRNTENNQFVAGNSANPECAVITLTEVNCKTEWLPGCKILYTINFTDQTPGLTPVLFDSDIEEWKTCIWQQFDLNGDNACCETNN